MMTMNGNTSISQEPNADVKLNRILANRKRDCCQLDKDVVISIASKSHSFNPDLNFPEKIDGAPSKVQWLLAHHLRVSADNTVSANSRRNALRTAKNILVMIDEAVAAMKRRKQAEQNTSSQTIPEAQKAVQKEKPILENGPKDGNGISKKAADTSGKRDSANVGGNPANNAQDLTNVKQPAENAQSQPVRTGNFPGTYTQMLDSAVPEIAKSLQSPHYHKVASTSESQETQQRRNLRSNKTVLPPQSECAAASGSQQSSLTPAITPTGSSDVSANSRKTRSHDSQVNKHQQQFPQKKNIENEKRIAEWRRHKENKRNADVAAILKAKQDSSPSEDTTVVFPEESEPCLFSCAQKGRLGLTNCVKPQPLKKEHAEEIITRFNKWDPYWKVCQYVSCGVTTRFRDAGSEPANMAARCVFSLKKDDIKEMKRTEWGRKTDLPPRNNQMRLIFRMLPVSPDKQKARADYHLWPKGTFVVLNKLPVVIDQRKQQSHDFNKWLGLCKPLDLTSEVRNPSGRNEIQLLTYDDQQYYYCIALCRYVAPSSLFHTLISPSPHIEPVMELLSREESLAKALTFTQQTMVSLDDDEDNAADSAGRFVFTLTCPFSKKPLVKPVRGKSCRHFQVRLYHLSLVRCSYIANFDPAS